MPLKVLVIDNNAAEATLVDTTLGAEGYEVATVTSLDEALSVFRNGAADLVLLSSEHAAEAEDGWWHKVGEPLCQVPIILIGQAGDEASVPPSGSLDTPIDTHQLIEVVRSQVGASEPEPAMNWLPDALKTSSTEMTEMEQLIGWTPVSTVQPSDPVSLGIFSPDEMATPSADTVATAPSDPMNETAVTAPPDASIDALDLPETTVPDTPDEAGSVDAIAALESLEADTADEDDTHDGANTVANIAEGLTSAFKAPDADIAPRADAAPDETTPIEAEAPRGTANGAPLSTHDTPPAASASENTDGNDFADALEQQVSDDIDAAFAAFGLEENSSADEDDDEGDEVIAEDLIADELIGESIASPGGQNTAADYNLNDAAHQVAAEVFSKKIDSNDVIDHQNTPEDAESDSGEEVFEHQRPMADPSAIPGENPLADVMLSDGSVPLGTEASQHTPPSSTAPSVIRAAGRAAELPDNLAGLPMEQVERIVADTVREVVQQVVWETVPMMVAKILSENQSHQDKLFTQIVEKAVWECLPALAKSQVQAEISRISNN